MALPLLPLGAIVAGLFWLDDDKKKSSASAQPVWTPQQIAELTETAERDGCAVRSFRPDVAAHVARVLRAHSLEPVAIEGGAVPGHLFKLVPRAPEGAAASELLDIASEKGLALLATLSVALLGTTADQMLWLVPPGCRVYAGVTSQFAVLQDVAPKAEVLPKAPPAETVVKAPPTAKPKPKKPKRGSEAWHEANILNGAAARAEPSTEETLTDVG